MTKSVKQTKKHKIDQTTGLIKTTLNINDHSFFYKPSFAISLTDSSSIRLTLPDGTVRLFHGSGVRQWTMAIADRDDHYNGPGDYQVMTTLDAAQEAHIRSLMAGTARLRYKRDRAHGNAYISYQYEVCKKEIFHVNFPATVEGVRDAKIYAKWFEKNNRRFVIYYEIEALNNAILNWKKESLIGSKYIYRDRDYYAGVDLWAVRMPLNYLNMSETHKTTYEGTEEGLALAKAHRAWVVRYGELPPWKGTSLSNIHMDPNRSTKTGEKNIQLSRQNTYVTKYFDGEIVRVMTTKTLAEAKYVRNKSHILGDISAFNRYFEPTAESLFDQPMHVITPPTDKERKKKRYVSAEKQQQVHDELVAWIKMRNQRNTGLAAPHELAGMISLPPLTPYIIEAVVLICDKMQHYSKYRRLFGEAMDRMQQAVLEILPRMLHYYKPSKGTPFTFLTMIIINIFDRVRNQIRQEYQSGNPLPQYGVLIDNLIGNETLANAYNNHNDIDIDEQSDDVHSVAGIIRSDIAKYLAIAEELNITFAEYLILCKSRNKIITIKNYNHK